MIPRMFLLCVAAIAMTSNAFGQSVPWVQPMGGTYNTDWTIVNYVDLDPGNGTKDYTNAVGSAAFTYNGHTGIDMTLPNFAAMERGVSVFAAAAGTVSFVEDRHYDRCSSNCNLSGNEEANIIKITHTNGFETLYYHLARNSALVHVGDTVTAGQQIALVGSSGNSSDAHLHFEAHSNGNVFETYLNPTFYWANPLPYAGDGVRAIDSGFTRQNPTDPQLRDRPSDNDVIYLSDGTTPDIYFWAQTHSVAASDVVTYRVDAPNGSQTTSTPNQNPIRWGWALGKLPLPSNPLAGVYTASVLVNGNAIRTDQFTVVAAPQTRTWASNASFPALWSTAANWSGTAVPGAGEDVRITPSDGIPRAIIYDQQSPTLKSLFLDLTGPGSFPVKFYSGLDMSLSDSLIVGDAGRAEFNQTGGRITTANPNLDVAIGWHTGSNGIYNMSANSALHVSRGLYIGTFGFAKGTFNQSGGTTTTGSGVILGTEFGALGTYNLSGGTLNVGAVLYAGYSGQGDVSVTGRSQVITRDGATLGYYAGSRGTVTLDGERTFWDTVPGGLGEVIVGREGTGTLNIRNGATVNHVKAFLADASAASTGTVNVDNGGFWDLTDTLVVAVRGVGNLNITNGGKVTSNSAIIGDVLGSVGTVVIDGHVAGGGSYLSTDTTMWIGYRGNGNVTVSNNASLFAHDIHIGDFSTGVGRLTAISSGDVFTLGTTTVGFLGTLDGDGYVSGHIRNYGVVNPATSPTDPGALLVGDYIQETQGTLKISLASASDYSQLNTVPLGSLLLNGILNVTTSGGFAPGAGQSFDILNSNIITGTFQTLQLPTLVPGLVWNTSQLYTTGVISVVGSGLQGDFNTDGYVDARDYLVFRKRNGTQAEYDTWRANFGRNLGGAGSSVSIPEPATATLFVGALMAAMVRGRSFRLKSRC